MSDVVRITGEGPVHHPGNPHEKVVKECEELLERARAGEIVGVAYAAVYYDNGATHGFAGDTSRAQIGRLFGLMTELSTILNNS